jgi:hypothetical protein
VFAIPGDHLPEVLEGLAQAERGELASDDEIVALWKNVACEAPRHVCSQRASIRPADPSGK